MNKYLLKILQDANTIIIPGLGALTITNKEKMEIMFMSYLKHDDGKLSGYIAKEDGLDEAEAKIIVAKYVRDIHTQLDKGESYDMFEFGSFSKAADGEIEFKNWDKTTSSPEQAPVEKKTEAPKAEKKAEEPKAVKETPKKEAPKKEVPKAKAEAPKEKVTPPKKEAKVKPKVETPEKPTPAPKAEAKKEEKPKIEAKKEKTVTPIIPISAEKKVVEEVKKETPKKEEKPKVEEKTVSPVPPVSTEKKEVKAEPVRKPVEKEVKAAAKPVKEKKEPKAKKKRGAGFWILMILIAVLIAGGTYVGMNYDEVKQHIPFLADDDSTDKDEKSAKDKMLETLNGPEASTDPEQIEDPEEGEDPEENQDPEEIEEPEVVEPEVVTPPTSSGNGPYHIVAGAFGSKANADRLAAQLQSEGLPATVILNNGMNVVSMKSFASIAEANASLAEMKEKKASAWVLYKP